LAAEFHDYDWRLPVAQLGGALAERVRAAGSRVAIVAHSLGGLVARAALALAGTGNVERLVLLGTPHCGSFAAVQALRGTYAVVRKVARLAGQASAECLAAEVFSSFPSLYELLPAGGGATDLFDERAWAAAVVDMLRRGATTRLPGKWLSGSRACTQVSDRQLRRSHAHKVDWAALAPEERRLFLQTLNEPPHFKLRVPGAPRRARRGHG